MPFTTATAQKILNKILRGIDFTPPAVLKVSLHTDDPGETGANEIANGGYERQTVTYDAPSAKTALNPARVEWDDMPACTVTHVGLWDEGGTFWWGGPLIPEKILNAGDSFRLPEGSLPATLT